MRSEKSNTISANNIYKRNIIKKTKKTVYFIKILTKIFNKSLFKIKKR